MPARGRAAAPVGSEMAFQNRRSMTAGSLEHGRADSTLRLITGADDVSSVASADDRSIQSAASSPFVEPGQLPRLPKIRAPHAAKRQADCRAIKLDFGKIMDREGTYVLARRALRRAQEDQLVARAHRLEMEHRAQFAAAELATVVRLSTTTGTPTLTNPIEQQIARRKRMMPKPLPPPRKVKPKHPNWRPRPRRINELEAERRDARLAAYDRDTTNAAVAADMRMQSAAGAAIRTAAGVGGGLDRAGLAAAVVALGLGGRELDVDLGIPSAETAERRERDWWAACDDDGGVVPVSDATLVLVAKLCDAQRRDGEDRDYVIAYRELLTMEAEDEDAEAPPEIIDEDEAAIRAALAWPTLQYRPFNFEHKTLAPAPPMWREDGSTGAPCDAPPLAEDGARREGHRSLETHGLICVEQGLTDLPCALGTTLHLQLGISLIQLPRNRIATLHSFGRTPQIGCRSLVQLVELRLPGNGLALLPDDVGLLQQLKILDLTRNSLYALPRSFLALEGLVHLDLTHNNYKDLPDDFGALTSLETLGLADNILQQLPSTLPRLHALEKLDLSGNGLTHLCIFPNLPEVARKRTAGEEDWDTRMEPLSHKHYYCNLRTGKVQRIIPAALRLAKAENGGLELGLNSRRRTTEKRPKPKDALRQHTAAYNHRKVELAGHGVNEWSVAWSDNANAMVYTSNVNGEDVLEFPSTLDTLGRLRSLRELKLDQNQLRVLPPSLGALSSLSSLRVRDNYLRSLPDDLGSMQRLTKLDCTTNELSELPPSTAKLTQLTFLSIQSNRFERLPPLVGRLTGLKRLMLGNNSLTTLPYEVGFLTTLVELQVFNNPLIDPPYETISDLPQMMWSCRQKYWALINGPLPEVAARRVGVNDEVLEPEPAYQRRIASAVQEASYTGRLELQLQGVHEIPGAVRIRGGKGEDDTWTHPALEKVKVLKLNMNHFKAPPLITASLGNLRVLWLKACEIEVLNNDIDHLQRLRELNLESNKLTGLPRTFCRLRRLEVLNLAKNRIYLLPERIGNLTALVSLDLCMNNLEYLPESITELRHLQDLKVAVNQLYKLPVLAPGMSSLTSLNLDANELNLLPARLGELPLKVLRASHNRIERLEADTFTGKAATTLTLLGVASNNLLELPSCLPSCEALKTVHVEYNPMRNPPAELLSEGMTILLQYCRLRDVRIEKFKTLLDEFQFDFDAAHLAPEAYGVMTGRTGFLTPDDLIEFDSQTDRYLNGPYYSCPSTDLEILERVDNLRHEREHTFYHIVLQALIDLIGEEVNSNGDARLRKYACGVLVEEKRPWGRRGEDVGVFALALDALVKETAATRLKKVPRAALFDVLKERLPPSLFEYTLEVLKDAIQKYQGPYGSVAQLDKIEFERCECVDDKGRTKGHRPCVLPAVVIVKVVYSAGEALRRTQEDDKIRTAWGRVWGDIETKTKQRHGKLILANEVHRRKRDMTSKIKSGKEKWESAKNEAKRLLEKFEIAKRRKINYENGDAFNFHRLDSSEQAENLVTDAAEDVDKGRAEIKDCERLLAIAKAQAKMNPKLHAQVAVKDLKRKYCVMKWQEIFDEERWRTVLNDWRRPWDGFDGANYRDFTIQYAGSINLGKDVETLPTWVRKLKPDPAVLPSSDPNDRHKQQTPGQIAYSLFPYNWEHTDDMDLYENVIYDAFEKDYVTETTSAANRQTARDLRDGKWVDVA